MSYDLLLESFLFEGDNKLSYDPHDVHEPMHGSTVLAATYQIGMYVVYRQRDSSSAAAAAVAENDPPRGPRPVYVVSGLSRGSRERVSRENGVCCVRVSCSLCFCLGLSVRIQHVN